MNLKETWLYRSCAIVASSALIIGSSSLTLAQDTVESEVVDAAVAEVADSATSSVEEVVVTGSRLKRSTFTSISPLQIVTAEVSREAGLMGAAEILQTSTLQEVSRSTSRSAGSFWIMDLDLEL